MDDKNNKDNEIEHMRIRKGFPRRQRKMDNREIPEDLQDLQDKQEQDRDNKEIPEDKQEQDKQEQEKDNPEEQNLDNLTCPYCMNTFNDIISLNDHILVIHDNAFNVYICNLCGSIYESQLQLDRHVEMHRSINTTLREMNESSGNDSDELDEDDKLDELDKLDKKNDKHDNKHDNKQDDKHDDKQEDKQYDKHDNKQEDKQYDKQDEQDEQDKQAKLGDKLDVDKLDVDELDMRRRYNRINRMNRINRIKRENMLENDLIKEKNYDLWKKGRYIKGILDIIGSHIDENDESNRSNSHVRGNRRVIYMDKQDDEDDLIDNIPTNIYGKYECPICVNKYTSEGLLGAHFTITHNSYDRMLELDNDVQKIGFPGIDILSIIGMVKELSFHELDKCISDKEECLICGETYNTERVPVVLLCCSKQICTSCLENTLNNSQQLTCLFCNHDHTKYDVEYINTYEIGEINEEAWIKWWSENDRYIKIFL